MGCWGALAATHGQRRGHLGCLGGLLGRLARVLLVLLDRERLFLFQLLELFGLELGALVPGRFGPGGGRDPVELLGGLDRLGVGRAGQAEETAFGCGCWSGLVDGRRYRPTQA